MQIIGVYHVATMGNYQHVVDEQFTRIDASGLSSNTSLVFVGIVGDGAVSIPASKTHVQVVRLGGLELYENVTINLLRSIAGVADGLFWYIHTKGVSKWSTPIYDSMADWRRSMEYGVIDHHDLCVKALQEYDVCGTELCPARFYCGNFWWSKSEYLRRLDYISPGSDRIAAEKWVSARPDARLYNLFSNHRDFYRGQRFYPHEYPVLSHPAPITPSAVVELANE